MNLHEIQNGKDRQETANASCPLQVSPTAGENQGCTLKDASAIHSNQEL